MNNKVRVKFEDLKEIEVPYKTKAIDAVKLVEKDISDILALKINNEIKTYEYKRYKYRICSF